MPDDRFLNRIMLATFIVFGIIIIVSVVKGFGV